MIELIQSQSGLLSLLAVIGTVALTGLVSEERGKRKREREAARDGLPNARAVTPGEKGNANE